MPIKSYQEHFFFTSKKLPRTLEKIPSENIDSEPNIAKNEEQVPLTETLKEWDQKIPIKFTHIRVKQRNVGCNRFEIESHKD